MNKSTLARLNPPSSILLTPSRSDNRTPRRNNTGGTSTIRSGEAEEANKVEVEQVGTPIRRRVTDVGESKRKSMVVTPASLRPPVIVSITLTSLVTRNKETPTDPSTIPHPPPRLPAPHLIDPTTHPILRPPSDHDQRPHLLFPIHRYAVDIASFPSDTCRD